MSDIYNQYRIHHIRPRFKNDVESVLFFIANSICNIGKLPKEEFRTKLNASIRFYPGNMNLTEKTINNWRTEISALFGLIITDDRDSYPSDLATHLSESGNLIYFFQTFLSNFQYPGGHLKPHEVVNMVSHGIRFKPVPYLLKLLVYGTQKNDGKRFGVSKEEITHLVFNNLDVSKDNISHELIFNKILNNRNKATLYDTKGDVIRYAGDILDYMVLADLLDRKLDGKYYPRMQNIDVINAFITNSTFFTGYDDFYSTNTLTSHIAKHIQFDWQIYSTQQTITFSSDDTYQSLFATEESASESDERASSQLQDEATLPLTTDIIEQLQSIHSTDVTTKRIGDLGEAITIQHEKNRISKKGRNDLIDKILKIPEKYAVGYDIKSFLGIESDFSHIHIEVKSTISKNKLRAFTFSLTPNEFEAAKSHKDLYFVYRIFISSKSISMFVIRNPIDEFKKDNLSLSVSNGAQISFTENSGKWEKVLI